MLTFVLFCLANYCVTVFTLVGISILEAMLVNFLLSVDVCCAKRTSAKSAESQLEIQMDVKSHTGKRDQRTY